MFKLREEYRDYLEACRQDNTTPWNFRDWFETLFHYEIMDNL